MAVIFWVPAADILAAPLQRERLNEVTYRDLFSQPFDEALPLLLRFIASSCRFKQSSSSGAPITPDNNLQKAQPMMDGALVRYLAAADGAKGDRRLAAQEFVAVPSFPYIFHNRTH